MYFNKHGKGRISSVKLTAAEKKAMDREIWSQILANDLKFDMDRESVFLWTLHEKLGLGPKKLRMIWETLYDEIIKLREYYSMDPEDDGYLARRQLKSIGVDVEQWYSDLDTEENRDRLRNANTLHSIKED